MHENWFFFSCRQNISIASTFIEHSPKEILKIKFNLSEYFHADYMLGEKEAQLKIIFLNRFFVVSIKVTISTEN